MAFQVDNMFMINLNGDYIPYFRELNSTQLVSIENISTEYNCKNGDVLFLQGEFCQNWVIVYSGSLISRKRDKDSVLEENILLPGDSFDFESTIKNSVASISLEAIEECTVLVIDILGLKKLARKSPVTISLIKLQLNEYEAAIWENSIQKRERGVKEFNYIVRKSFLWLLVRTFPIVLFLLGSVLLFPGILKMSLLILLIFISIIYFNNRLSYIEINRDVVAKKEFRFNMSSHNLSIPIEKVEGSGVTYKNLIYKFFNLGELNLSSPSGTLSMNGVYKPQDVLEQIKRYKSSKLSIDEAIEISSFKYLYSKQNGLFHIDNQLEKDYHSGFTFRKSIVYFLIRAVPSFVIFLLTSVGLYFLFKSFVVFLLNIPSVFIVVWHFWDWINDRYAFEGDRVVDIEKRPFWGKEQRVEADILSVQSIKKEQKHIFQILFNYGDIQVLTLGGEIVYPSVNNPDKVIDNLYLVKKYYHSKKESMDKLQRQEEFLTYTKYYQELSKR